MVKKPVIKKRKASKTPTKASLRKEFLKADKLWKIWKIALTDLKLAERTCEIDMNYWLVPPKAKGEACVVCAAGSVIYRRFNFRPFVNENREDIGPVNFGEKTEHKMEAINELRVGRINSAYKVFHQDCSAMLPYFSWAMPRYEEEPKKFFERAKELLAYLKKENI